MRNNRTAPPDSRLCLQVDFQHRIDSQMSMLTGTLPCWRRHQMGMISGTICRSLLLFRSSICSSTLVRLIRTMSIDSIGRTSDSHSLQTVPEGLIFHMWSSSGGMLAQPLHVCPLHCGRVWHRAHPGTIPELTASLEPMSLHRAHHTIEAHTLHGQMNRIHGTQGLLVCCTY